MKTLTIILIILLSPILFVAILIFRLVTLFQPKGEKPYKYLTYNSDEEDIVASICWDETEEKTLVKEIELQGEVYSREPQQARDSTHRNFKYSI
jgi:hypothetical protein